VTQGATPLGSRTAGWHPDPYSLAQLRWWNGFRWTDSSATWDGTSWQLGENPEVGASYERQTARLRRERRPVQLWFWGVVVFAVLGVVPTAWAQQDFGQPMHGLSCSDEPWHVDRAGMTAWWVWCAALVLLVVGGWVLLRKRRVSLADDRSTQRMFYASIPIAILVPTIGWAVGYFGAGMNCGL